MLRADPMTIADIKTQSSSRVTVACARPIALISIIAAVLPAHSGGPASLSPTLPDAATTTTGHRNERSTPRSSVLPSSPAIAYGSRHSEEQFSVSLAKAVLLHLGYPVGRLDERITAKFRAAVFRYQRAHGIPSSGTLDEATLRSLGIDAR